MDCLRRSLLVESVSQSLCPGSKFIELALNEHSPNIRAIWAILVCLNNDLRFVSTATLYFYCIWNNCRTRISLTSFWSLRGQWQNSFGFYSDLFRAGNIGWLNLQMIVHGRACVRSFSIYAKRMGKNVFAQHERGFCKINMKYFLCYCFCCSWKQVIVPKIHKSTILLVQILLVQMLKVFWVSASAFYLIHRWLDLSA